LSQEASPDQFGACVFLSQVFWLPRSYTFLCGFFFFELAKEKKRDTGKKANGANKKNKEKPHLEKKDIKKKEKEKERSKRKRKRRENFRSACILLGPCAECIVVCLN